MFLQMAGIYKFFFVKTQIGNALNINRLHLPFATILHGLNSKELRVPVVLLLGNRIV